MCVWFPPACFTLSDSLPREMDPLAAGVCMCMPVCVCVCICPHCHLGANPVDRSMPSVAQCGTAIIGRHLLLWKSGASIAALLTKRGQASLYLHLATDNSSAQGLGA